MSTWISAGGLLIVLVTIVWRDGISRGRTAALLERLTDLAEKHDDRIRDLELGRAQPGHGQLLNRRGR